MATIKSIKLMIQYIPKDALIAEIDRIKKSIGSDRFLSEFEKGCNQGKEDVCDDLLSFIDTLEVKEVDFEKEVNIEWDKCNPIDEGMGCEFANVSVEQFYFIAKHFFELGLKATQN